MLQVTNISFETGAGARELLVVGFSTPVSCGAEDPGSINAIVPLLCCLPALLAVMKGMGALRYS